MTGSNDDSGRRNSGIDDSWERGDYYEYFMGRWSRLAARKFMKWLSPMPGQKWLDIGCGSGALSEDILNHANPAEIIAVDQSEGFLKEIERRLGNRVLCRVGDATALPVKDESVHFAVSGLVLNFISEPAKAISEMKRVIIPGGTVAGYVWDYSGKMELLNIFWDAVMAIDAGASDLHEGRRFRNATAEVLQGLFEEAGLKEIEAVPLEIELLFEDFDDYWRPFLGGQGPAPSYLQSLGHRERERLRERIRASLPIRHDGSIRMEARAWGVKGRRQW